ncbi:hypothetical protein ACLBX9_12120 [Methylobacterium sp. A49B]
MTRRRTVLRAATLEVAMWRISFAGQPWAVKRRHRDRGRSLAGGPTLLAIALATTIIGTAHAQAPGPTPANHVSRPRQVGAVGVASREADGSIVLTLRAEGPDGLIGDARFRYTPDDPNYGLIARHVGPIPLGGTVPVRPFDAR